MNFVKQFLLYGISAAVSRLAAILLVPLYTRTLSIQDYGRLEVLLALHTLFVLTAGLQSESAVARDYFEAKKAGTKHKLRWGAIVITLGGSILILAICLFLALLGAIPGEIRPALPLLMLMVIPTQLLGVQLVLLRFAGTPIFFATLSFLDLALSALFSAGLIVGMGLGVNGALAGILLSKLLCMMIAWPFTFGKPRKRPVSLVLLRRMLQYAVPTLPSVLLNWLQNNGNRILLALYLTLSDVALTGIAIKIAALYGFVTYSFRLAWEPYSFELLGKGEAAAGFYNRVFQWYVLLMLAVGGAAVLASPILAWLLAPPTYAAAAKLSGFFIIGQFWVGAIPILSIGIHGARITSRLTNVYALGALLNVAILTMTAHWIGTTAAGIGFLASAITSATLAAHYSNRHFNTAFSGRLIGFAIVMTTSFALVAHELLAIAERENSLPMSIAIYGMIAAALFAALALIGRFGFDIHRLGDMWAELSQLARRKALSQ